MIAYRLPDVDPIDAASHPLMARLLPVGPWQYQAHPEGGTLASWKSSDGRAVTLDGFAAGVETEDGLTYYAPLAPVELDALRRPTLPPGRFVTLYGGDRLHVAFAMAAPRKLMFGAKTVKAGDLVTEYASLVESIREEVIASKSFDPYDPRVQRMVFLAVQQSYRVTQELLSAGGWITDADEWPILLAGAGVDPEGKETGAGSAT